MRLLVPAATAESPQSGYAPLESRTKPWGTEPQIEGWFPLTSGERTGSDVLRALARFATQAMIDNRFGLLRNAPRAWDNTDAGCKTCGRQRGTGVCLDILPHRRTARRA